METLFETEPESNLRMVPEIKAEWISRLRSGRYQQGKGELKRIDAVKGSRYCCLGVLAEIAAENGIAEEQIDDNTYVHYDGAGAFLPYSVCEWANIYSDGRFGESADDKLVYLNDEVGYSFDEIADVIEEQL